MCLTGEITTLRLYWTYLATGLLGIWPP